MAAIEDQSAIARRFLSIVERVRSEGLVDEIASLEGDLDRAADPRLEGEIARLLGFFWLRRGEPLRSLGFSDRAAALLPEHRDCTYNAIYALFQLRRHAEVVARARAAIERFGDDHRWHNISCTSLGALGRFEEAREHGSRSLALKHALSADAKSDHSPVGREVVPFDPSRPERNIIGFSLFGSDPRYVDGAILNAEATGYVYPGWTSRFYVDDSVPAGAVARLGALGAQVRTLPDLPADPFGTFWRFLVGDDPDVDRFVVRDADSLVNVREAAAVQQWIASGRHFHVMRDHYNHSELVLAGMWGGVRGALPPLRPMIEAFIDQLPGVKNRTADQEFLRQQSWPIIRQSVLVHDSQFAFGERTAFPAYATLPPGCHVGGPASQLAPLRGAL